LLSEKIAHFQIFLKKNYKNFLIYCFRRKVGPKMIGFLTTARETLFYAAHGNFDHHFKGLRVFGIHYCSIDNSTV